MMKLYLNDCGIICPLGRDKASVARGLAAGKPRFVERTMLVPDYTVNVGAVIGDLPPPPAEAADLDCRNNRMMLLTLASDFGFRRRLARANLGDAQSHQD